MQTEGLDVLMDLLIRCVSIAEKTPDVQEIMIKTKTVSYSISFCPAKGTSLSSLILVKPRTE